MTRDWDAEPFDEPHQPPTYTFTAERIDSRDEGERSPGPEQRRLEDARDEFRGERK